MAVKIIPERGKVNAFLFKNENMSIPMTLFSSITLDLEDVQFQGESEQTSIQLDFINFDFRSFLDIEGQEFEFPSNPDEGYIDGSIYLDYQHIPVDITQISFGSFDGSTIKAKLIGKILFDYCGYTEPKQALNLEVMLQFENIFIPPDVIAPEAGNLDIAKRKLSEFFNLSELSEPLIESNGFRDAIVFYKSIEGIA